MSVPKKARVVPLPSGRHGMSREAVAESQRERIVSAMISATAELGYARVTVDDVSRRSRTAKRTFYELFGDKEACFLAAYDQVIGELLDAVASSLDVGGHPADRVASGVAAFIGYLADNPESARVGIIEIIGAGPAAAERRVAAHRAFADAILDWHEDSVRQGYALEPVSATASLAVLGVVNEPVTMALLRGGPDALREMIDEIADIVTRLMFRPLETSATATRRSQPTTPDT